MTRRRPRTKRRRERRWPAAATVGCSLILGVPAMSACDQNASPASPRARDDDDDARDRRREKRKKKARAEATATNGGEAPPGGDVVPAPTAGQTAVLQAGAYATYLGAGGEAEGLTITFALLERRADGSYRAQMTSDQMAVQAWVMPKPGGQPTVSDVLMKQGGGAPQPFPPGVPARDRLFRFYALGTETQKVGGERRQEDVEAAGRTFRGAYRHEDKGRTYWFHPAVPPPSLLRSKEGDETYVLTDFAYEGAQDAFAKK
ncbi:MAG: hypothetical protein AAF928_03835 [Myxococcota bacterium]